MAFPALALALFGTLSIQAASALECDGYLRVRHVFGDPVLGAKSLENFAKLETLAKEANGPELLETAAGHFEDHGIAYERTTVELGGKSFRALVVSPGKSRLGMLAKGSARRGWKVVYAPERLIEGNSIALADTMRSVLFLSHEAVRNLAPTVSEVHEARHLHLAGKIAKGEATLFDYYLYSTNALKSLLHGDESYFSYVHSEEISTYAKELQLERRRENAELYANRGVAIATTSGRYLKQALSAIGARERVTVSYDAQSRHAGKPMWFIKIQIHPEGHLHLVMTIQEAELVALLAASKQAKGATTPGFEIPALALEPATVAALQSHVSDKLVVRQQAAESWATRYRELATELRQEQPLDSPRLRKAIRALR